MYVSVRDCMLPVMGIADPAKALKKLGLSAAELSVGKDTAVSSFMREDGKPFLLKDKGAAAALAALLKKKGVSVCAFLMGNDFSSDDLEGEVAALIATSRAAVEMGVPAVRIDLIPHKQGMPENDFIARAAQVAKRTFAECPKIKLAIENHGGTSNRPEFLEKVFDAAGDKRLGLTLDTGNFYWFGHPLDKIYQIMETYGSLVYHTHCKNISYPVEMRNIQREIGYKYGEYVAPIYAGDVDHAKAVAILKKAGYKGSMCVEDESLGKFSKEEQAEVLKKDVDFLKSLV